METCKKIILIGIPMSICNFRCHYCYLAQRKRCYQGVQPEMKYTPEEFARGLSNKRLGGSCFVNMCADGETLLTKDIDLYIRALIKEGHFVEVVTNLTPTNILEKILSWTDEELEHLEFKCSFHYLELKKKNMLARFAENVNKIFNSKASATIEIVPNDELVPYINEIKEFSMKNFGALPHLTIARDDRTKGIDFLTKMTKEEYIKTWSVFESDMWNFKMKLFGVKQTDDCYAGQWQIFINMATGEGSGCYGAIKFGDVIGNYKQPIPEKPIIKCYKPHCYNCHALLTLGLIPSRYDDVHYSDIRNRITIDGKEWLKPKIKEFFNTKLKDSNKI